MKKDASPPQEIDLDKTDRLPILEGVLPGDDDFADDAVPMDNSLTLPSPIPTLRSAVDFHRPPAVDLPTLAETIRTVEDRIARQQAEYEALMRSFDLAREAGQANAARVADLSADLAAARTALEAEQQRSRQLEMRISEIGASAEASRTRAEGVMRESERHQAEAHTLRESLAVREASMAQMQHSLGERDEQLASLQRDHAKLVPELESRSHTSRQLETDLKAERAATEALKGELAAAQTSLAAQAAKFKRSESSLSDTRHALDSTKSLAASYLEKLRTREFRRGVDQNVYREMDDQVAAATAARDALQKEYDQVKQQLAERETQLAAHEERIGQLTGALASKDEALEGRGAELARSEQSRAELAEQMAALNAEQARLIQELSTRDAAVEEARAVGNEDAKRVKELLAAAERKQAEQEKLITELQAESESTDQEMMVLMSNLQEARRPIEAIQADLQRLTEELAAKNSSLEELNEENQKLRASLERTRGALEEREFLIRRLERAESNTANALGRIQTSMERIGGGSATAATGSLPMPMPEIMAELIRTDLEHPVTHLLARRTRIGRAQGCDLHIDSSSVSRHHALILVGPREVIIEDLNSTNGVIVNGRKVNRQMLRDGDALTIGEVHFRFVTKHGSSALQSGGPDPLAGA
jgi:chromosome segregation ATPase